MNLATLVDNLYTDTVAVSIPRFWPELILCATIVAMLLVRIIAGTRIPAALVALVGSAIGFYMSLQFGDWPVARTEIFTGLLVYDGFTVVIRAVLLFFALLFVVFTLLSGIPDREDAPDFYSLVLGGTLGMCLMASANHLLMIFLAVEMASVPSYVLAGILKGRRQSSEAALKYVVYGAGAAGVMLYGVSLLAGVLGSCHLPTMAAELAERLSTDTLGDRAMVLVLGGLMVGVGLAFKLSAFPFHFWCPDVFEGAAAEINAFLSVASKAAALALLVRVVVGFGYVPPESTQASASTVAATASQDGYFSVADEGAAGAAASRDAQMKALNPARNFMLMLVAVIAAVTCTFGNLAAYGQTNIKRLMAYSTIAHAGYMMMPVAAALALASQNAAAAETALAAIPFYIAVYLFMNLGAFAIVAFLRNELRSEEIDAYAGLVRRSPGVVICFSLILFSLVGLPPLAGFAGKYVIFASLVDAMAVPEARLTMIALLVIGGLNTALSLFYYVRVVKVMTLEDESDARAPATFSLASIPGVFVAIVTVPVFVLGLFWDELYQVASSATATLFG
ncbi:MAG TPA: NADH-quinone oxidoreductase subunit N [Pirellulales bacterium]|nr:NADH-quinone oxidoreductase subunit N [Pirellulales bacterium]